MNLYICSRFDVAHLQEKCNITKTLAILEYDPRSAYYPAYRGEVTLIQVSDFETYFDKTSPDLALIDRLVKYFASVRNDDNLLIHCHAGRSRSTAAALILLYMSTNDMASAVKTLLNIRPEAVPNRLMAKLADIYLNTNDNIFFKAANELCGKIPMVISPITRHDHDRSRSAEAQPCF